MTNSDLNFVDSNHGHRKRRSNYSKTSRSASSWDQALTTCTYRLIRVCAFKGCMYIFGPELECAFREGVLYILFYQVLT